VRRRPHDASVASGASGGVALFIDGVDPLDEALKQADIAVRQAKSAGCNTLRFFDPESQGALIGAEALARWRHPERGLVAPGEFIPLAEETGLILPIGQWVLEAACSRLKDWAGDPRARELPLSINVSARQFRQADFVDRARAARANRMTSVAGRFAPPLCVSPAASPARR
jgi:predicted signal transduction protein with EAL and GGDEF domain